MMIARPDRDEYYYNLAKVVASRATWLRASCGVVLVNTETDSVVSTGYNGALSGEKHCTEIGCDMEDGHCQRAIHAEINAVTQAAKLGHKVDNTMAYVVKFNHTSEAALNGVGVCRECRKVLMAANIRIHGEEG